MRGRIRLLSRFVPGRRPRQTTGAISAGPRNGPALGGAAPGPGRQRGQLDVVHAQLLRPVLSRPVSVLVGVLRAAVRSGRGRRPASRAHGSGAHLVGDRAVDGVNRPATTSTGTSRAWLLAL